MGVVVRNVQDVVTPLNGVERGGAGDEHHQHMDPHATAKMTLIRRSLSRKRGSGWKRVITPRNCDAMSAGCHVLPVPRPGGFAPTSYARGPLDETPLVRLNLFQQGTVGTELVSAYYAKKQHTALACVRRPVVYQAVLQFF